jgi:hypothetical protein
MITLRAFRAIDDHDTCKKFMVGHRSVLENIGVKKVTSSMDEWMTDPYVFVIIVETEDRSKVFGGARIHVAGGKFKLPVEEATGFMDKTIYDIVGRHIPEGTGEICGLWNSREVAGMGIGAVFLTRAAIILSKPIQLTSLFALCAPYTVKMAQDVGYRILTEVGNNGTFYYPKIDLLATAMILDDVNELKLALPEERLKIFNVRNHLNNIVNENYRGRQVQLKFLLDVPNIENWKLPSK